MQGAQVRHHKHTIMDTIEASIMGWDDHKPPLLTKQARPADGDDDGSGVVLEVEGRRRRDHRELVLAACSRGWVGTVQITERTSVAPGAVHRVLQSLMDDRLIERRHTPGMCKRDIHRPHAANGPEHEYRAVGKLTVAKWKPSAREALMKHLAPDWQPSSDLVTKAQVHRSTLAQTLRELAHEGLCETRTLKGTHYKEARATPRLLVWRMSR